MTAEKVILTGEMLDDYVEVKMRHDMVRYARVCFAMPVFSKPSKQWIAKYANKFWGLVTYENGKPEDLILIGIIPMDGNNFPSEGFEDKHYIYSEKFRIFIDDKGNVFTIDVLDKGWIHLGGTDATEHAVLGDVLKTIMEELIDALKAAKTNTSIGPQPFMLNTQNKLTNIKNKLDTILSKTVKLK